MKTFKPYSPEQSHLLPPSPRERLPEDHLAYFIGGVVDTLDLSAIIDEYTHGDGRGRLRTEKTAPDGASRPEYRRTTCRSVFLRQAPRESS